MGVPLDAWNKPVARCDMNCIVTAGPTFEPLDQVRRLTNLSSGQLGTELALFLASRGHEVTLLRGHYAVYHAPQESRCRVTSFTTTNDLHSRLQALAESRIDAVFHAAAVNDFGFGQVFRRSANGALEPLHSGKFSTRDGALLVELVPTPKIIVHLRDWFRKAWLVGWKYEVDGGRAAALAAGREQLRRCRTNACIVNGPAYGKGFGFLTLEGVEKHMPDPVALFAALADTVEGHGRQGGMA